MLDSFFGKAFKASKCKTLLKLTIPRIKLLRNRREIQMKQMRREIAKLLETGQEASARIRVENILREEKMAAAQEIVELFCELIAARLPIIEAQKECPLDLNEAISSVCFAASRCADLPELQQVRILFAGKYGKEFVSSATELMPECGVNRQLIELLSVRAPSPDLKLKLLKEIAKEHQLDWDPSPSENELSKTHDDLLNGPVPFVSGTKTPQPEARNDEGHEAKSETSEPAPDSDDDFEIIDFPEVPKRPLQSNVSVEVDELEESKPSTNKLNQPHLNPSVKEDAVLRISTSQVENKQFVPFMHPPPFSAKEDGSSPPLAKNTNDDTKTKLHDVLAAAQAAADTAESAAAAAQSASSLAHLRIAELVKKKNEDSSTSEDENPFHLDVSNSNLQEEAELDADNPFAYSTTTFTSPSRNQTTNLHTFDDSAGVFDSYPDSETGFSYDSYDRPQTLSSMDDETYFSYPNLFTSHSSK